MQAKPILVEVCSGSECVMMGAMDIMESIEGLNQLKHQLRLKAPIRVVPVKCIGCCKEGNFSPVVRINGEVITRATSETIMAKIITLISKDVN